MTVRKTIVASLFLAVAFLVGAGEVQAQYQPIGGKKGFSQTQKTTFNRTPQPVYVWRNGKVPPSSSSNVDNVDKM